MSFLCVTGAATLLALLAVNSAVAAATLRDDPCWGHGTFNATTGFCDCDRPWPDAGQSGWTGRNCSVPVWGGAADGSELTAPCAASGCAHLAPGAWVCFALKFPWSRMPEPPGEEWHFLAVQLNR